MGRPGARRTGSRRSVRIGDATCNRRRAWPPARRAGERRVPLARILNGLQRGIGGSRVGDRSQRPGLPHAHLSAAAPGVIAGRGIVSQPNGERYRCGVSPTICPWPCKAAVARRRETASRSATARDRGGTSEGGNSGPLVPAPVAQRSHDRSPGIRGGSPRVAVVGGGGVRRRLPSPGRRARRRTGRRPRSQRRAGAPRPAPA